MKTFEQDPLWAYDETLAAITALTDLVTTAMGTGEEFSRISYGVSVMFDQQCSVLQQARGLVHEAAKLKDRAEAGIRRVEPAGLNMVMVTEPDGRRYMTTPELAGVSSEGVARPRMEETTLDIRKRVIAELVSDGKAVGEIAQTMNLKAATVERVIGQLLSRQADDSSGVEVAPAKAVNQ